VVSGSGDNITTASTNGGEEDSVSTDLCQFSQAIANLYHYGAVNDRLRDSAASGDVIIVSSLIV
jgi:hypothetical protein